MEEKNTSLAYAVQQYGIKNFLKNAFSIAVSDAVVVSFQKSGRTWLRLMLGKILEKQYGIKKIKMDTEFMTLFKPLPNVLFSHAGCTKNHNQLNFRKIFRSKKVVVLARDPRALMVSLFHDHTKRNKWYQGGSQSDFLRNQDWGLPKVIKFMNDWAEEIKQRRQKEELKEEQKKGQKEEQKKHKEILLMKYENLYLDTAGELKRLLDFLGLQAGDEIIEEAVQYGSVDSMRRMELAGTFKDARMLPGDVRDRQSYRTRKCKLGSFREELSKEDIDYINRELKEKLDPLFGYPNDEIYAKNDLNQFQPIFPETEPAMEAVLRAGEAVREVYRQDFSITFKGENNPLTEADLKSNQILQEALAKTGYPVLSEEEKDNQERLSRRKVWIIDPLDGTQEFTNKEDEFVVMVALVENHKPIIGIIYQPTTGHLFVAEKGNGAYQNIKGKWQRIYTSLNAVPNIPPSDLRATISKNHPREEEQAFLQKLGLSNFRKTGSAGLKIVELCRGSADFYFTVKKIRQWDTAAGYCILAEAGGKMTDLFGNELLFNVEELRHLKGIMASNGRCHDYLVEEYKKFVEN